MSKNAWKRKRSPIILPLLVSVILLWGTANMFTYISYRHQIGLNTQLAHLAYDKQQPLTERLRSQLELQTAIEKLQLMESNVRPWYKKLLWNGQKTQLDQLWPLYERSNNVLVRDAAANILIEQLSKVLQQNSNSLMEEKNTNDAYDQFKAYLMMATPQKVDAQFLSNVLISNLMQSHGIRPPIWRTSIPELINFYTRHLPQHPEWKITLDLNLVKEIRNLLSHKMTIHDTEESLYQSIMQRVQAEYPAITLEQIVNKSDARALFFTDETVPGMFTRQAWEGLVHKMIDDTVERRRKLFDWVLTSETHPLSDEISPETLKLHLTARYFTNFSTSWITFLNSLQWRPVSTLTDVTDQLSLMTDAHQSPFIALMNAIVWQGGTAKQIQGLGSAMVPSLQDLLIDMTSARDIQQCVPQDGPLKTSFGPLLAVIEGKRSGPDNRNLSLQSLLSRIIQMRLKLQQIANAPDPQAMTQSLVQTIFQGKSVDFTDTLDYSTLVAACLGDALSNFGQSLFVQPIQQAWLQLLKPTAEGINNQWQQSIVNPWNQAFSDRYPFSPSTHDASLYLFGQYIRKDMGRIEQFIQNQLRGLLRKEGHQWMVNPIYSQELSFNPEFLQAINLLSSLSDQLFARGDMELHFDLMPQPFRDVVQNEIVINGQPLKYFNQMESWQSFVWPGETLHPGALLSWSSTSSGTRLLAHYQGNWALFRLLDLAQVKQLDATRYQLTWVTPDKLKLIYIMRSDIGNGPLALLALKDFQLPETIFNIPEVNTLEFDTLEFNTFEEHFESNAAIGLRSRNSK